MSRWYNCPDITMNNTHTYIYIYIYIYIYTHTSHTHTYIYTIYYYYKKTVMWCNQHAKLEIMSYIGVTCLTVSRSISLTKYQSDHIFFVQVIKVSPQKNLILILFNYIFDLIIYFFLLLWKQYVSNSQAIVQYKNNRSLWKVPTIHQKQTSLSLSLSLSVCVTKRGKWRSKKIPKMKPNRKSTVTSH